MGEKDMSEKILEDYNDVFSDIVNVLLFHGQELIEPSALESISVHSQYKGEDAKLHEQERDVAKNWNFDTYNSLTPNWYYKVLR